LSFVLIKRYHRQFGFLKDRSTVTQLLQIVDDWTEALESGGRVDVTYRYTDFEKAFDKVPHKPLLNKLKSYKIHNSIIKLNGLKMSYQIESTELK